MKRVNYKWILAIIAILFVACEDDRLTEDNFLDKGSLPPGEFVQEGVVKVYNPYWEWANKYPGNVADTVYRFVEGIPVTIDANFIKMHPDSRLLSNYFSSRSEVIFSTGLYVPPAEEITIICPPGFQHSMKWRIGATTCVLKTTDQLSRYPTIHSQGDIDADTIRLVNYFGGHLYFRTSEPIASPVTFTVKGCVKSPDYIEGETDVDQWLDELKTTGVPAGEIRLKRVIWTLPTYILKTITDKNDFLRLVDFYNDAVKYDFNEYSGLSDDEAGNLHGSVTFPTRHVTDIQTCAGAAHAGYPAMYGETYGTRGVKYETMITGNAWGWFHELGHNYQYPIWMWPQNNETKGGGTNEVTNNFHIFHSFTRRDNAWPAETVAPWQGVIDRYVKVNDASKNFDAPVGTVLGAVINEDKARIIPFMQLAQKYGWRLFAYLGKTSRELSSVGISKLSTDSHNRRREFFCLGACEWAQKDLRPFFDAWGFKYEANTGTEMGKLPALDPTDKFWETFDASVIPSFAYRDTANFTKLNRAVIWTVPEELDRNNWTVHSQSGTPSEGSAENLINGTGPASIWASASGKRPIFDPQHWIIFDLKQKHLITWVQIQHRQHSSVHLHLKKFTVLVSDDPDPNGTWTSLGVFETTNSTSAAIHKFENEVTPASGRYVKFQVIEAWPKANPAQETGAAQTGNFWLGGMPIQ